MRGAAAMWRRRLPLLAAALLFAGGNLALLLGYRSITQTRREALEARRDGLKSSVEAREAEAERLSGQEERLSGVSSAIEEFYGRRIGPERETLAPIVDELHAILKETGVAATQISYTTTAVEKLPIAQMRINFSIKCDYARFKKLLRAFESSRRWIVVRDVSISRDTEQSGSVLVQLDLVTYFAEREAPGKRQQAERAGKGAAASRRVS